MQCIFCHFTCSQPRVEPPVAQSPRQQSHSRASSSASPTPEITTPSVRIKAKNTCPNMEIAADRAKKVGAYRPTVIAKILPNISGPKNEWPNVETAPIAPIIRPISCLEGFKCNARELTAGITPAIGKTRKETTTRTGAGTLKENMISPIASHAIEIWALRLSNLKVNVSYFGGAGSGGVLEVEDSLVIPVSSCEGAEPIELLTCRLRRNVNTASDQPTRKRGLRSSSPGRTERRYTARSPAKMKIYGPSYMSVTILLEMISPQQTSSHTHREDRNP